MKDIFFLLATEKLAVIKWNGKSDLATLETEIHEMMKQLNETKATKCLIDLREAEFSFSYMDGKKTIQSIVNNTQLHENMRFVFLTDCPKTTIFVILFIQLIDKTKYFASLCSTLEYAFQLLNVKTSELEIRKILSNGHAAYNNSSSA